MLSPTLPLAQTEKQAYNVDERERERRLLMARRQALIIELGAIEEYLGLPRSITPTKRRNDG